MASKTEFTNELWTSSMSEEARRRWYLELRFDGSGAGGGGGKKTDVGGGGEPTGKLMYVSVRAGTLADDGFHVLRNDKTDKIVRMRNQPLPAAWVQLAGWGAPKTAKNKDYAETFGLVLTTGASERALQAFPDTVEKQREYLATEDAANDRIRELILYNEHTRRRVQTSEMERSRATTALERAWSVYKLAHGSKKTTLKKDAFYKFCRQNDWTTPEASLVSEERFEKQQRSADPPMDLECDARRVYLQTFREAVFAAINGTVPNRCVRDNNEQDTPAELETLQKKRDERQRFERDPAWIMSLKVWAPARERDDRGYMLTEVDEKTGVRRFTPKYEAYLNRCSQTRTQAENERLMRNAMNVNDKGEYHLKYNRPIIKFGKQELRPSQLPRTFTEQPFPRHSRISFSTYWRITLPPGAGSGAGCGIHMHKDIGPEISIYEVGEDLPERPLPDEELVLGSADDLAKTSSPQKRQRELTDQDLGSSDFLGKVDQIEREYLEQQLRKKRAAASPEPSSDEDEDEGAEEAMNE